MAKENEITSTEKLLDVIRGEAEDIVTSPDISNDIKEMRALKLTSLRHSIIGVDIGRTNIKLVKMNNKGRIKDFALVPIDPKVPMESQEFVGFFKSTLQGFIGRDSKYKIWAAISGSQAEIVYFKIPKVPAPQLANVILLSFRKDYPFTDQERLFDFSVIDETVEEGETKTEVIAYSVPRDTVSRTKLFFENSGFNLAGLTVYPFALQSLFKSSRIAVSEETYCCLLLGLNWSRIDIFRNGDLMMSRGVKTGINSMFQAINDLSSGSISDVPDQYSIEDDGDDIDATPDMSMNQAELASQLFFKLSDGRISNEASLLETTFNKNDLREAIIPVINRLARQVDRTIEHYALNISNAYVGNIYFQSEFSVPSDVFQGLAEHSSIPITILDPFEQDPSLLGFTAAGPQSINSKIENSAFNAAFGLALSNSDTPNILRPYTVKSDKVKSQRTDTIIAVVAAILMVLLIGGYTWQRVVLNMNKNQIENLEAKINEFQPIVTQNILMALVNEIKQNKQTEAGLANRYKSLAVIKDISGKTPSRIRLTNMTVELGSQPEGAEKNGEATKKSSPSPASQSNKMVILEGIVFGESATLEPALAEYLLQLESSPLMTKPSIQSSEFEDFEGRQGLAFKVEVELI